MYISQSRAQSILESSILKLLKERTVPSTTRLAGLNAELSEGKDLSKPFTTQPAPVWAWKESSSAAKINKASQTAIKDLDIAYDSILEIEQTLFSTLNDGFYRLDALDKRISELLSRADRLLLTATDSTGALYTFGDNFRDSTNINTELSNVYLDGGAQTVHSSFLKTIVPDINNELDLSKIEDSDITLSIESQGQLLLGTRNSRPTNILKPSPLPWVFTVSSVSPKEARVSITIDLGAGNDERPIQVDKIALLPGLTNNAAIYHIRHSADKTTWQSLPCSDLPRRLTEPSAFIIPGISLRYLQILIQKDVFDRVDGGVYLYDFGIKHIGLYGYKTIYQDESYLVSKELGALDQSGAEISFNKVNLIACERVESGTSIDFSLAFITEDGQTDFYPIMPSNRIGIGGPKIVEITQASKTATEAIVDLAPINPFPFSEQVGNHILNIEVDSTKKTEIRRNLLNPNGWSTCQLPDGTYVDSGWSRDGDFYLCCGEVEAVGGLRIELGNTTMNIDNREVTGSYTIPTGEHLFKIHKNNWYSLEGLHEVHAVNEGTKRLSGAKAYYGEGGNQVSVLEEPTRENGYTIADPLYPFNHKATLEGLKYSSLYNGPRPYRGLTSLYAYKMTRVQEALFSGQIANNDYKKYAIINPGEATYILLKWLDNGADEGRELFSVIESGAKPATGVVVKALFKTTNPRLSASLESYQIKVI